MSQIVISAVTKGELLYGLAHKGHPSALTYLINEFLLRVDVLPWGQKVARNYGDLRASGTALGITLSALDMMIAAHAVASKAILVTHDKTFSLFPAGVLAVQDWTN